MPSTGHKCSTSGIYRSDCSGRKEIALSVGETFPPVLPLPPGSQLEPGPRHGPDLTHEHVERAASHPEAPSG